MHILVSQKRVLGLSTGFCFVHLSELFPVKPSFWCSNQAFGAPRAVIYGARSHLLHRGHPATAALWEGLCSQQVLPEEGNMPKQRELDH